MTNEGTVEQGPGNEDGEVIYSVQLRPARLGEYLWVSLVVAAVLAVAAFAVSDNSPLGVGVGLVAALGTWLVWRRIRPSPPPFSRPADLVLTTKWLIAYRANHGPEVDRRPLVDLEGSRVRVGFSAYVPARLTLTFDDGDTWVGALASNRAAAIGMHELLLELLAPE